jgi:hypothetical protein
MIPLASLKRRQTKSLAAIVRRVKAQRRLHRYVPTLQMLEAEAALTIIRARRKRG